MLPDRKKFNQKILRWWNKNQRKFPWRSTRNPYRILVSEIFLHRTKADQVVPVYTEFVKRFPSIDNLAHASKISVKKILHPLGLHWRSMLLHDMAKDIVKQNDGKIPSKKNELESLPGIGHYIASAVRCFAFGYPEVLLDTNTVRIIGRVFGVKVTDASRRSKHFRELYQPLVYKRHSREFNYAMIDLGALLCRPLDPKCGECPVKDMCRYGISVEKR